MMSHFNIDNQEAFDSKRGIFLLFFISFLYFRENVRVLGFGWFILPVFCGAYVELQTDHLQVISAVRQLRIYCAGVWHNFVSSMLAIGLWWSLPYFYLLFYSIEGGAVVSDVYKVILMSCLSYLVISS